MNVTAREAALTALERCRRDNAWSGAVIDNLIDKFALDSREASLASKLCLGVLQNNKLCDFYISCYCCNKLEPKVRDILRMGVYQLTMLDKIPARAAVNESVELCRVSGCERAAGLVNAVLQKISANVETLPDLPGKGGAEYLRAIPHNGIKNSRLLPTRANSVKNSCFFIARATRIRLPGSACQPKSDLPTQT